jgi:hypothetical protein
VGLLSSHVARRSVWASRKNTRNFWGFPQFWNGNDRHCIIVHLLREPPLRPSGKERR